MNEKTSKRFPLSLTAEQLDHKDSLARTENKRARNRLHISKETLAGHENTNVSSLDYEMRRLKHELRGIQQTSGYFILNHEEDNVKFRHRPKRRTKTTTVSKKRQSVTNTTEVREGSRSGKNAGKTVSLPVLSTISPASSDSSAKHSSKSQECAKRSNQNDNNSRVTMTLDTMIPKGNNNTKKLSNPNNFSSSTGVEIVVVSTTDKDSENTVQTESKELTKADTMLGLNVDAARNRIQNRLTISNGSTFQVQDDDDLTPYMHVPPDGLPRTAYLLPPLEELLREAKKARYIRKFRKRDTVLDEDDPERELNIDEIFSKIR